MTKINTKIVADSISPQGHRITTMLLTYPRMIHSELMTHRMFSRNSASSRAIPFNKMVKKVEEDPFIPIAFQKNHKGMQGTEYWQKGEKYKSPVFNDSKDAIKTNIGVWRQSMQLAVSQAEYLNHEFKGNVTKQLCNRLLEPFMWHTVLVTATEFDNFFELRCPKYKGGHNYYKSKKDYIENYGGLAGTLSEEAFRSINYSQAEIHIQALAESMWDAMNESEPQKLNEGEWHIPFGDQFDYDKIDALDQGIGEENEIKIAVARAARLSYANHDGEINYEKDIELHDKLLERGHMSPFEHVAKAMTEEEYVMFLKGNVRNYIWNTQLEEGDIVTCLDTEIDLKDPNQGWCNNLRGFISYRYMVENE